MKQNSDDVVIRRIAGVDTNEPDTGDQKESTAQKQHDIKSIQSENRQNKQIKAFAVLLFLFSVLLFIALLSYTRRDEANAELSFFDLFGLITGDEAIQIKAETSYNWLGLLGAYLANFLFNHTIGYAIIFLPLFIIIWAKNIYQRNGIPDKLLKSTGLYLVLGTLFSALTGVLQTLSWMFEIPKEWSGSVGQFIAAFFISIIGSALTNILLLAAIFAVIVFGANINLKNVYLGLKSAAVKSSAFLGNLFKSLSKKNIDSEDFIDNSDDINEIPVEKENLNNKSAAASQKTGAAVKTEEVIEQPEIKTPKITISKPKNEDTVEPARIMRKSPPPSINDIFLPKIPVYSQNLSGSESVKDVPVNIKSKAKPELDQVVANIGKIENKSIESLDEPLSENVQSTNSSFEINLPKPSIPILNANSNAEFTKPLDSHEDTQDEAISEFGIAIETDEIKITPQEESRATMVTQPDNKHIFEKASLPSQKPLVINLYEKPPEQLLKQPISAWTLDEEINFVPPHPDLLIEEAITNEVDEAELKMNARILQEKLETFKIYIENLSVTPGPVVTQYEFVPAAGIKISKIESLADDLAMALKARGIRIIAPIPGKGTIGVEIPNQNPSLVTFSSVISSARFINSSAKLPIAMGKTISGEVFVADLTKMPHLLIAGSTGSGKSVGINTVITSLLYKKHPKELKFVIIDPKKVELQHYSMLAKHYMAISPEIKDTIITNPQDAVIALKAAVIEMERRYDILASAGQRNIHEYNRKVAEGKIRLDTTIEHKQMPYIVVVIDELADLMLTASKEIEEPIIRLAQMARAVGIHLVIATQRPSVDVITGIIKANFPARIAYLVASKIDSRTILDTGGAEQLLGNGDMLFLPSGSPKPIRVQNSYLSNDEVENICGFIGNQNGYSQPYSLPCVNDASEQEMIDPSDRDPLFEDAARLVIQHQQGSVSLIQRRLKVGYARAGRIIDELESAGVVGPFDGSKARLVLMDSESELEAVL